MTDSAHARYRERLAALAGDSAPLRALAAAEPWLGGQPAWVRTFGRFEPDSAPYATLLFEASEGPQAIARVDAFESCPSPEHDETIVLDGAAGWLRVTRFPLDPALPTLPAVLEQAGRPTVVRYRPYRRCTIRFDDGGRVCFAKVYRDDHGARIHAEGLALWRAATSGALDFLVARPLRWDAETRALWQGQVQGTPIVARLFGAEGLHLARRMGRAAASLTRSGLEPGALADGAAQLARSRRRGAELSRRVPRLAADVSTLIEALTAIHTEVGPRRPRPIHGAPHAQQWLDDGSRLGLVDFDGIALGDPELDVAHVLAELDFETETVVPAARLAEAFLAAYESVAGAMDRRLLAAYRAHKGLSKALNAAQALRPDGDGRAERKLRRVMSQII
jgi:hypothetical protein